MRNHTACECECQWKSDEDCKVINPNYVKDDNSCSCRCPVVSNCDYNQEFDYKSCKCVCNKEQYSNQISVCKRRNLTWNEDTCR